MTVLQGEVAPEAPPFPSMKEPVMNGLRSSMREMAIRVVRRVYEHIAVWRLGLSAASPFLRDGVAWVHVGVACCCIPCGGGGDGCVNVCMPCARVAVMVV